MTIKLTEKIVIIIEPVQIFADKANDLFVHLFSASLSNFLYGTVASG